MEVLRDKVTSWLDKHWRGAKNCPVCGSNSWWVAPDPVEVRRYAKGALHPDAPVYPLASVLCTVCGNTLLFNAILIGAVEKDEAPNTLQDMLVQYHRRGAFRPDAKTIANVEHLQKLQTELAAISEALESSGAVKTLEKLKTTFQPSDFERLQRDLAAVQEAMKLFQTNAAIERMRTGLQLPDLTWSVQNIEKMTRDIEALRTKLRIAQALPSEKEQ